MYTVSQILVSAVQIITWMVYSSWILYNAKMPFFPRPFQYLSCSPLYIYYSLQIIPDLACPKANEETLDRWLSFTWLTNKYKPDYYTHMAVFHCLQLYIPTHFLFKEGEAILNMKRNMKAYNSGRQVLYSTIVYKRARLM